MDKWNSFKEGARVGNIIFAIIGVVIIFAVLIYRMFIV